MCHKTKTMSALLFVLLLLWSAPFLAWSMAPAQTTRVVILFDTSGSMRQNDPQNLSRTAVQLLLEIARPQDAVGLVAFSDRAARLMPLTPLSSPEIRQQFLSQLRTLSFTGQTTDLGAALERGLDSFPADPEGTSHDLVLLLTDGHLDLGPSRRAEEPLALARIRQTLLPEYRRRGIALYTIAFTVSADRKLLEEMAQTTAGAFRFTPQATMLHKAVGQLFILANQAESLPMQHGAFLLDKSIRDASLIISKRRPADQITLGTPRGQTLSAGSSQAGVTWRSSPSHDLVHLVNPEPGAWQVKGSQETEDSIAIIGTSTLGLQVELKPAYVEVEESLHLAAFLHEEGQKVRNPQEGMTFHANITTPGGETLPFPLPYQDGGVFATTLTTLREPGRYDLVITATAPNLRRQRSVSFLIYPPCFQSAVVTQVPITASVTLADACPRFLELRLEAALSTQSGATTWIPLVSSQPGVYQATMASPPPGQTGQVVLRISGRLQGGEAFTRRQGPWALTPPPPQVTPAPAEHAQVTPARDASVTAQYVLLLIGLLLLVGNAALGFLLWRARQAHRQLQGELRTFQQTHAQEDAKIPPLSSPLAPDERRTRLNTSLQYVTDNVVFLQDAFTELVPLLEKYAILLQAMKDNKDNTVTEGLIGEVETLVKQADVDYLLAECPQAIQQALEGIKRVSEVG